MDQVREARIDLAAALRLAARFDMQEGICNHFSYMVPSRNDCFLVNPQGLHWPEIAASSLLLVANDGSLLEGDAPPEPTAYFIHWRIHQGLPHARAVLHTHMPYATAITSIADGRLEPISQKAVGRFGNRVAYDDEFNGFALDEAEGDRMTRALGNRSVLFLANHGVIVTGTDLALAFDDLYYLERTAQNQWLAMSMGRPLRIIPEAIASKTTQQYQQFGNTQGRAHFAALKRMLDREEPDYKN